ncbi:hypothetical protein J2Z48_001809 [Croceifilum oryzae]|uniref:Uncharacterized protein n=1 Tax=Croceifilum oryzae TaxID=1553429 RepID=A0AAJ1TK85_9BACL|nr:hypothetical protein [Croceifilum oryzae]
MGYVDDRGLGESIRPQLNTDPAGKVGLSAPQSVAK